MVRIETLSGDRLDAALDDLARLRIAVFREWPYLYDGDAEYEARYLERYRHADNSVLIAAFDDSSLVGASTGAPLQSEEEAFRRPFEQRGDDVSSIFYFAESVLMPDYRGRGLGHAFFDAREAHARGCGNFRQSVFCSVIRPSDHPARPKEARSLDPFWRKRGYEPLPGYIAEFPWKDVGDSTETNKPMQFWGHTL